MPPPGTEAMPFGCVRKRTEAPRPVPPEKRYKSMEMVMRAAKRAPVVTDEYYVDIRCEQCRSGDADESMLLCDRCDRGYHIFCLRPILARVPSGPWFCPCCVGERQLIMFPLTQTKILDFFRVQKFPSYGENGEIGECAQELRRRKRRSIIFYKKKRRFLAFSPTNDPVRRLEQMQSLATALTALHMDFSNDLSYIPGMVPKSANQAILEKGGMQVLSKEDTETLELCRAMHRRGECPPLIVVFDSQEGFTVVADSHIKDMTLITEYVGDVDYLWNREHDDCDSLMTLLLGKNPSDSLVICPDRCGNIARFINGINNHSREGKKKQNLKCVRYDVRGECRVLLIACRDISKGERLYYDYNGYEHEYPTHHFV